MASQTEEQASQSPWQNRFIVLAAILFPLLVGSGVLAPQVISVMIDESKLPAEEEPQETPDLNFDETPIGLPPLPLPRDFDLGFIPELLDLQHLFSQARATGDDPLSRRFARLLSFPRDHGDLIVMDDVDRRIQEVVFKDPLLVAAIDTYSPPDGGFLALSHPRPLGDGLRFDDPQSSGEGDLDPVPEPSSALLLLGGLIYLARRRQR